MKLMTSEKQLINKDWGENEQGLSDVMEMLLYLILLEDPVLDCGLLPKMCLEKNVKTQ